MKDMTKGNGMAQVLLFAIPLFAGSVLSQIHVLVDSIIVGRYLGVSDLAAIGVAGPIVYFIVAVFIGLNIGFAILVSQFKGADENTNLNRCITTIVTALALGGVLISAVAFLIADPVLTLFGAEASVQHKAKTYFTISSTGLVFGFISMGLGAALRGLGDGVTPLYVLAVSSVINIVLDFAFIVYWDMGIEGAAYATVVAQAVGLLLFCLFILLKNPVICAAFKEYIFDLAMLKRGALLGLPLAAQHIFLSVGILLLVWIVIPYGTDVVAAVTIVGRIETFTLIIFIEIAAALTTFVGQNKGAANWVRITETTNNVIYAVVGISLALSVITLGYSQTLVSIFTSDQAVIALSKNYLDVIAPFLFFIAVTIAYHGVFNGMSWVYVPMLCTLLAFCFTRIPLTYFLGENIGTSGIWWATVIGWVVGWAYSYYMYRRMRGGMIHKQECFQPIIAET
jgi:putative efflux protein, MATE family